MRPRIAAGVCACALLMLAASASTGAHTLLKTQVLVTFDAPGRIAVTIDVDLGLLLGSAQRYYELATEAPDLQRADGRRLAPEVADNLQLRIGDERLAMRFVDFTVAQAQKSDYLDTSMSKDSTFRFVADLPPNDRPLRLVVPIGAKIDFPVAYTVQIPVAHVSITRWLEPGMHESDPFEWAAKVAKPDPDGLPWHRQLRLYLRLGFHHIVPDGADHILFVLGLFFLGVTWRKLLAQTTVFTVAHATTLFLSTYGIFRLPGAIVEPAIAVSIAWIAIENVVKPQLGWTRLTLVFGFGLVHGLGFASSLSEVPFPKRDFVFALLGFNAGVDLGQLFVIAMAFLAVGWFRNRPWFRSWIAVPASLAIAATGLVWAVGRVMQYDLGR